MCPQCGGSNPQSARFCMLCAAPLTASATNGTPVTGPTRRLDPPAPQPAGMPGTPVPGRRRQRRNANNFGPLFLIGLGLLFMTRTFWPGIFVLLAAMALLNTTYQGHRSGLQGLVFFAGLAFLFSTHLWWPGLLLWFGAMSWVSARYGGRGWW